MGERFVVRGFFADAAQRSFDARQHLLWFEGLGDVVVGAELEQPDLVADGGFRRENDHRRVAAEFAAQFFQQRFAAHSRQHQIQQDQIRRFVLQSQRSFAAGIDLRHLIIGLTQHFCEQIVDVGIVLNDENRVQHGKPSYFIWLHYKSSRRR